MSRANAGLLCLIGAILLCGMLGLSGNSIVAGTFSVDPATRGDFSCEILMYGTPNQYVAGKPVVLTVRLTNQTERDMTISYSLKHYLFCSFDVVGPTGERLELRKKPNDMVAKADWERLTIGSGRVSEARIDLADWYDLSKPGKHSIGAKWRLSAEQATDAKESNTVVVAIVPQEQAAVAKRIGPFSSSGSRYGRARTDSRN